MDTHTKACVEYILEHEYDDYWTWCADEDLDPTAHSNAKNQNHIYARAATALEEED